MPATLEVVPTPDSASRTRIGIEWIHDHAWIPNVTFDVKDLERETGIKASNIIWQLVSGKVLRRIRGRHGIYKVSRGWCSNRHLVVPSPDEARNVQFLDAVHEVIKEKNRGKYMKQKRRKAKTAKVKPTMVVETPASEPAAKKDRTKKHSQKIKARWIKLIVGRVQKWSIIRLWRQNPELQGVTRSTLVAWTKHLHESGLVIEINRSWRKSQPEATASQMADVLEIPHHMVTGADEPKTGIKVKPAKVKVQAPTPKKVETEDIIKRAQEKADLLWKANRYDKLVKVLGLVDINKLCDSD